MGWVVAESYTLEELAKDGLDAQGLKTKWENVADDMALIPERNVNVIETAGSVRVEVSEELYSCMRGI